MRCLMWQWNYTVNALLAIRWSLVAFHLIQNGNMSQINIIIGQSSHFTISVVSSSTKKLERILLESHYFVQCRAILRWWIHFVSDVEISMCLPFPAKTDKTYNTIINSLLFGQQIKIRTWFRFCEPHTHTHTRASWTERKYRAFIIIIPFVRSIRFYVCTANKYSCQHTH